jgi:pimeloyl-ACP methyl ester carboxylesterase
MRGDVFDELVAAWPLGASVWTLDYCSSPGVSDWKDCVLDLAQRLDRLVLVGHSFGGMLLLTCAVLEERLGAAVEGWVFLDSAPNNSWSDAHWPRQKGAFPEALREAEMRESEFAADPTEEGCRNVFLAYAPYYFEPSGLDEGRSLLSRCRYDARAYALLGEALSGYAARWIPEKPALILAGEKDRITPIACFADDLRFQRPNVAFETAPRAGHFPWVENPAAVFDAFARFERRADSVSRRARK